MKVNIEQKETEVKVGMFKKEPGIAVTVSVDFSEEEKQIIKDRDLSRTVVMERTTPFGRNHNPSLEHIYHLEIFQLLKEPNEYIVATPKEAKEYEAALIEQLKLMKEYIAENAEIEEGSTSFEL